MRNKILSMFSRDKQNNETMVDGYSSKFENARSFTEKNGFKSDCELSNSSYEKLDKLIVELTTLLPSLIENYKKLGFENEVVTFGGDCGNVHLNILNFINDYYPSLCANITLGEISSDNMTHFPFNQNKCIDWMQGRKTNLLDGHAWITIGDDIIIDCTIGTYLNTRIDNLKVQNVSNKILGGILFGKEASLQYKSIEKFNNKRPERLDKLKYSPVILGLDAMCAFAPKAKEG